MKKILTIVFACAVLAACSQNAKKEGGVVAAPPVKNEKEARASQTDVKTVKPDELLPEVAAEYSGVIIRVISVKDNSSQEVEAPFNTKTAVKNSPLEIEVQSYFPNFVMANGGVANRSMAQENPGAKVVVYKNGKMAFDGWLFQRFPEMHPFEDPDFTLVMTGAVKK